MELADTATRRLVQLWWAAEESCEAAGGTWLGLASWPAGVERSRDALAAAGDWRSIVRNCIFTSLVDMSIPSTLMVAVVVGDPRAGGVAQLYIPIYIYMYIYFDRAASGVLAVRRYLI